MNVAIFKAKIRKLEPKDWISVTTTIILSLKKQTLALLKMSVFWQ